MISHFHCMMMFHDNKAALISAERSGENTRETNRCCKHHLHKSTFNDMFTSQRIDLFECIYLPRGNLIGIERLCCESRSQESSLPDWQTHRSTRHLHKMRKHCRMSMKLAREVDTWGRTSSRLMSTRETTVKTTSLFKSRLLQQTAPVQSKYRYVCVRTNIHPVFIDKFTLIFYPIKCNLHKVKEP